MSDPSTMLHYTANGNFVKGQYAPGADGFNMADISSASQLSEVPSGDKALVWLGMTGGVTAAFKAAVESFIGSGKVYGFYLADEPSPSATTAANFKAESDWIHANDPGAKTFIIEENSSGNLTPKYYYTPANTDIDLFGLDPYPVQTNVPNHYDLNIINLAVQEAETIGIPQKDLVPVYQAFGGGGYASYILPTPTQERQILSEWGSVLPTPAFDYAYSWGVQNRDTALSEDSALQQVFAAHNAVAAKASSAIRANELVGPLAGDGNMTVPAYSHIVVVVEENHSYNQIIGNANAPYINSLVAGGELLTNYHALSHPSLPNYCAMYAGSTFGVGDGNYHEPDPTLYTILHGAGKSFTGYVQGYTDIDHDPWEHFPEGTSVQKPFSAFPTKDFSTLPTVSFVIPDDSENMHSGSIATGDTWLKDNMNAYAQWAKANNSLMIVTWDENNGAAGNQVATILDGAGVAAGTTDGTHYNHYDLLSTLLAASHLTGPRNAASAIPFGGFI